VVHGRLLRVCEGSLYSSVAVWIGPAKAVEATSETAVIAISVRFITPEVSQT